MNLVQAFYEDKHGCYIYDTVEYLNKTQLMIDYLTDAKVSFQNILRIIQESQSIDYLKPSDLPDWLWENSLLKRDTFYFHKLLKLTSGMPSLEDSLQKQYIEMQIYFTVDDVLNYYYQVAQTEEVFKDDKKDKGAVTYLLKQYSKMQDLEGIDFLLHLIDYAAAEEDLSTYDLFYIDNKYRSECYTEIRQKVKLAQEMGYNRILWRQGV